MNRFQYVLLYFRCHFRTITFLKLVLHSEYHLKRLQLFVVFMQKCERLLLRLYCNELSTDFQEPVTPSVRSSISHGILDHELHLFN